MQRVKKQQNEKIAYKKYFLYIMIWFLLFITSYAFDRQASLFFKGARFLLFDIIFSIVTNFWVMTVVLLIIPSIILYKRDKKPVYLLWTAFLASLALAFVIKLAVLRQRPIGTFAYPFSSIINYSFPSMHAMAAFSLVHLLAKYFPKQKYFWAVFAFLVAFSRIYLGFHFLSDVVFGSLAGYFIGGVLLELHRRGKLWA